MQNNRKTIWDTEITQNSELRLLQIEGTSSLTMERVLQTGWIDQKE